VPLDQLRFFSDGMFDQDLAGEPTAHTQEMYAVLDSVVQAVLTDQGADIGALLRTADSDVQAIIDRG
jgi:multiple sugar transport system substrate-binding protein